MVTEQFLPPPDRAFRNFKKGAEESAAHSDSLGNSRKLPESPAVVKIAGLKI